MMLPDSMYAAAIAVDESESTGKVTIYPLIIEAASPEDAGDKLRQIAARLFPGKQAAVAVNEDLRQAIVDPATAAIRK